MANTIRVPKGKIILINKGGKAVPSNDIQLVLEEDITLSLASSFSPLVNAPNVKLIDVLGTALRDITGGSLGFSSNWQQFGYQVWSGTEPAHVSATVGFYMGSSGYDDAEIEVVKPTIELCSLVLPTATPSGNLIAPGPSLLDALGKTTDFTISIEIGKVIRFPHAIITQAQPTFSSETDSNDFPIWSKIQIDIKTIYSATTNLINFNNPKRSSTIK